MERLEGGSARGERPGGNILDTDSSITILDIPCSISNAARLRTSSEEVQQNTFPESIDPAFADYYFVFPQGLESFVSRIKNKRFVYRFSKDKTLEIVRCRDHRSMCTLDVVDFEKDEVEMCENSISLVLNRSRCRSSSKAEEDKEYRRALEEGRKYVRRESRYESRIEKMHLAQITGSRNFIFVDDPQSLPGELKAVVKHLDSKGIHIPKTKTFSPEQKTEHLQHVLQSITGIGKNVARSLSLHFRNISRLHSFLENDSDGLLKEFKIWDSDGKHSRPLGEKQSNRIKSAFGDVGKL
ncbi:hypothetical protein M970_070380 [Encephalitozoon cuniculi EcunIII-L]|nr:hypothetical protein M970_070380 [Encephalitozoon cuniculi EcunIII-L]